MTVKESLKHMEVPEHPGQGHETRDANANVLFLIGGGLIVLILVIMAITFGILKVFEAHPPASPGPSRPATAQAHVVPPEPRLQANPEADLRAMRAREDTLLASYGWIDQRAGIAHIPIDTAIEILAARQLPYRTLPGVPEGGRQIEGIGQ